MGDGFINFNLNEKTPTIIKVIGVGGGGGNAVEYMYCLLYTSDAADE